MISPIQPGSSTITPSSSVRNLRVIFDDQLTFKDHIAKTARSCRFAFAQNQKDQPFLTQHAAQLLVQALVISRLDYYNTLLAGLPSCTIKPLQMIQTTAAWLVFSEPKEPMSHLSLSPYTDSRLQLASSSRHWTTSTPEVWDLRVSDTSWCHHREAQNHSPERFHSPFLAGRMNFPPHPECWGPWQFSSDTWKLISSVFTWRLLLHKKN